MPDDGSVVIVGGTRGIGLEVARHYVGRGRQVVVTGRDADRAQAAAREFGGRAKDRPYVGAMTVATVNGGVSGMVRALGVELAPIRVNAIHPGIVGDSPFWSEKPDSVLEGFRSRTPTGKLATMQDVVAAVVFLLENRSVNGVELDVDGGWLML